MHDKDFTNEDERFGAVLRSVLDLIKLLKISNVAIPLPKAVIILIGELRFCSYLSQGNKDVYFCEFAE